VATASDITAQIRATLLATDPDLDTSVGTTTRKIIDAVAEQIAEAYIDNHFLAYQYDVNSKSGTDLDVFVALFGMTRIGAKRATGTVAFSRSAGNSKRTLTIPIGTMIGNPNVINTEAQTVAPAFLSLDQTTVTVPVAAVQGGPTGNIGAGLLTQLLTPLPNYLNVTNVEPLSGGTDQETDDELRLRWKQTVFRNLAGTEQMYLGVALDDAPAHQGVGCYAANVVGASKRHREQIQIQSGTAISEVQDAAYVYALSPVMGPDIDNGIVLIRDQDYTFDTSFNPPKVTMLIGSYWTGALDGGGNKVLATVQGAVFDLDFEYVPLASRNDAANAINNRIDIWCAGKRPQQATQSLVFNSANVFGSVPGTVLYTGYYYRDSGVQPTSGNVFIPLAFGPIMTIPGTISISGTTYVKDTDYWLVHQDIPFGLSPKSYFGLEWISTHLPAPNSVFSIDYTYNEVPTSVQKNIDRWRLIGTDALAHEAKEVGLRFNLAVMFEKGADRDTTITGIRTQISKFLSTLGFASVVQVSDMLNKIHEVPGVDNVRFLNGSDWTGYDPTAPENYAVGIQQVVNGVQVKAFVDRDTSNHSPNGRAVDIEFGDAEVPIFDSLGGGSPSTDPSIRAQNTFVTKGY
jgi:hypothetical protein